MAEVSKKTLWLILVAVALNRACSLLPTGIYFDPFPLYDIIDPITGQNVGINLQSFAYMIANHLTIMVLWYGFILVRWKYSTLFYNLLVIELFSLIDFFVIYEHYWFKIGWYPLEFTDIKLAAYAFCIWKTGRNT